MRRKAIYFDLDETVLDRTASLKAFLQWQVTGMLRHSVKQGSRFIGRFIELDDNGRVWKDKVYKVLVEEFQVQGWTWQELLASYELCFCGFARPKQGVTESIQTLSEQGYLIGLVSNGMTPFQERNFYALAASDYFDDVIVSAAVGLRKPDRRIFELACRRLCVRAEDSVFIGDNPEADIKGANKAGMRSVFIPKEDGERCIEADENCRDLLQLPIIVQKLLK